MGRAGDGRGIPGDPGQVPGAGDAMLCIEGNGLSMGPICPMAAALHGDGVGSIPAGLGACRGFRGELATPNALPGPGDGCGSMEGDGLMTAEGNEGGEARENVDVAGLEPNAAPCCCCCCCCCCCDMLAM